MKYLSVCSGIEAATTAWHPMGWKPIAFSEIEKFPSAVLAHHYPDVPNLGDMTKYQEWPNESIDLLVGGTPCQSFSVAGLRKGLDDPRGNLMLTYGAIAGKYRPRWLVWENVPGVLSSNGGRDFGAFLGMLAQLGYGFAYRVLDAQYVRTQCFPRAVPQRRRRVFVVGHLGDWRRAAAVLFERESLCGHPAPRRAAREGVAPTISARTRGGGGLGTDFDCGGGLIPHVAGCLNSVGGHAVPGNSIQDADQGYLQVCSPPPLSLCLNAVAMGRLDAESETLIPTIGDGFDVAHTLKCEGFDASEDGTGRGTPLVPVAIPGNVIGRKPGSGGNGVGADDSGVMYTLTKTDIHAVAFAQNQRDEVRTLRVAGAIPAIRRGDAKNETLLADMAVRRLTPMECERLQGFPDGYTDIRHGGKATPDGPRYKAIGNSMAVNVMAFIGQRIDQVDKL